MVHAALQREKKCNS